MGASLSGGEVLVSRLVDGSGSVEVVVGVTTDATFGPVVVVGAGGVLAEVLDDVAMRVPPFGPGDVRRMLAELRVWPVLQGARGRPPVDVDALVDTVLAVQRLAVAAGPALVELDLNPVLVRPDGLGAVALDALVVPRPASVGGSSSVGGSPSVGGSSALDRSSSVGEAGPGEGDRGEVVCDDLSLDPAPGGSDGMEESA